MLIDNVIAADEFNAEWPDGIDRGAILRPFQRAFVVRAQNVWEYYQREMLGKVNSETRFPNVAPPSTEMWFEWTAPNIGVIDPGDKEIDIKAVRIGALCMVNDLSALDERDRNSIWEEAKRRGFYFREQTRWFGFAFVVAQIIGEQRQPHILGRVDWQIGRDGELFPSGRDGYACSVRPPYEGEQRIQTTILTAAQVCWLAISFMHCKNMRIEKSPPIPERLRRARERNGKHPLFRHHTLVINPARTVSSSTAAGDSDEGAQPLHICRGHFKDFRARGLFGTQHGVYWWPMHVRGSAANGTVGKDYEVRP